MAAAPELETGEKTHLWILFGEVRVFHPVSSFRTSRVEDTPTKPPKKKNFWTDWDVLRRLAVDSGDIPAKIVGEISSETAVEWLDWHLGELYVVFLYNSCVFCTDAGTVVVV